MQTLDPNSHFCVDTRLLKAGDVYCALPGMQVDGHQFVAEAFKKGAAAAVVLKEYQEKNLGPLIVVDDVLKFLQQIAKEKLEKNRPKHVIAVTGSLGKTTTKDFIYTLLKGSFSVCKSPGNYNSQIGLPLTLLNHWHGEEVLILEMAMTHPGQIQQLVEIAPPDIAVLTKVALVHAANFTSLEEIAWEKLEIFHHPKTKIGIYSKDIPVDISSIGSCRKIGFSADEFKGDRLDFAEHNLHNLQAALTVATALGISQEVLEGKIHSLELPSQRLEPVLKKGVLFINDSYNAALDSVIAGLKSLPVPKLGRKRIAVLGSMMELGKFSEECHAQAAKAALSLVDNLLCYGIECLPMLEVWKGRPIEYFTDQNILIERLRLLTQEGDVVYIKGSKSKMMWKILEEY